MTVNVDFDDLTLDEAILFEESGGFGFGEAMEIMQTGKGPQMRILAAFSYVIARRDDPDLEFEHYLKNTSLVDITATAGSGGKAKKKPAAKRGSKRAATTGSKTGRSSSTSSGGSRRRTSGA